MAWLQVAPLILRPCALRGWLLRATGSISFMRGARGPGLEEKQKALRFWDASLTDREKVRNTETIESDARDQAPRHPMLGLDKTEDARKIIFKIPFFLSILQGQIIWNYRSKFIRLWMRIFFSILVSLIDLIFFCFICLNMSLLKLVF